MDSSSNWTTSLPTITCGQNQKHFGIEEAKLTRFERLDLRFPTIFAARVFEFGGEFHDRVRELVLLDEIVDFEASARRVLHREGVRVLGNRTGPASQRVSIGVVKLGQIREKCVREREEDFEGCLNL